jgi:UDP-N-acetylmuramate dehydrogenase
LELPVEAARALGDVCDGRLQRDVALARYTTFRIGGPADYFLEARTAEELCEAVVVARRHAVAHFVLGVGANILVGDLGFRGLVIRNLARRCGVETTSGRLVAESGAIVYPDVIELAVQSGLSGLEHYVGIPSTIGGALWQNLHFLSPAPDRERTMFIAEVVHEADILSAEGERRTVGVDYFRFGYDYSVLHERDDIVLRASFNLEPDNPVRMRRVMRENLEWRRRSHPPLDTEPSVGSIFKKIDGVGAGRLIDRAGLKGTRVGGAQITRRHANILINRGDATASDVVALIHHIQRVVEEHSGYRLEPEILFVGEFAPPSEQAPYVEPE